VGNCLQNRKNFFHLRKTRRGSSIRGKPGQGTQQENGKAGFTRIPGRRKNLGGTGVSARFLMGRSFEKREKKVKGVLSKASREGRYGERGGKRAAVAFSLVKS